MKPQQLSSATLAALQSAATLDKAVGSSGGYSTPESRALTKAMKIAWDEVFPGATFSRNLFIDKFDELYPNWRGYYVSYQVEYGRHVAAQGP